MSDYGGDEGDDGGYLPVSSSFYNYNILVLSLTMPDTLKISSRKKRSMARIWPSVVP